MEAYYYITIKGRRELRVRTRETVEDVYTDILEYLSRTRASTSEQIASELPAEESTVKITLMGLIREKLVRREKRPTY